MNENLKDGLYTVIHTEKGKILIELEYKKAPMTVMNFIGLADGFLNTNNDEDPFYDGLNFHRVIPGFMIQGGCPDGTGRGGPGYRFPDEFDDSLKFDAPGVLAMANAGPGTNGSQFFITHVPTEWLNDKHSIFGHVVEGQDIVNSIIQGDKIEKVEIIRIGKDAENFECSALKFEALVEVCHENEKNKDKIQKEKVAKEIENRYPNAIETKSGLKYVITKEGLGDKSPKYGKNVTVHYEGSLLNGQLFDSSLKRGEPATFQIGQVIEGWNEALQTMKKGEKRTLIIPPELGYGLHGFPGLIPPNSTLIFDVELLDF